jgi:ubiquinone/menaquinone biosynthesis C-methylase UbiE
VDDGSRPGAKQGEIDYLDALDPGGREHAIGKPYSDAECGTYLGRVGQIINLLPPPPARVLELGCGTGWLSVMLARRGYEVVARDISPGMIDCANKLKAAEGVPQIDFAVADYESLAADDKFDGVVFFDSLHHAVDEYAALGCAYRALRAGGVCVLSEPGSGHSRSASARDAVSRFGVTEKDMPPTLVRQMAISIGFKHVSVYPHASQVMPLLSSSLASQRSGLSGRILALPLIQPVIQPLILLLLTTWWKRRSGVVKLEK